MDSKERTVERQRLQSSQRRRWRTGSVGQEKGVA